MKSPNYRAHLWLPVIPLALLVALLDGLRRFGVVPPYLLPSPFEVFESLRDDAPELLGALASTVFSAVSALLLSFFAGTALAVLLSLSGVLKKAIYPYAVFFQTVPIIAIAPLLVIWFGFGRPTVIASAFIVSIFPVIASTLLGLESTDRSLVDLFKLYSTSYRVSVWTNLWKLRLPFALPQIFSGLKIAAGLSVIGAIVGEFIAGGGLGSVVDAARTQQKIEKVFAAVLISALLGLAIVAVIDFLSRYFLRHWHASVRD